MTFKQNLNIWLNDSSDMDGFIQLFSDYKFIVIVSSMLHCQKWGVSELLFGVLLLKRHSLSIV